VRDGLKRKISGVVFDLPIKLLPLVIVLFILLIGTPLLAEDVPSLPVSVAIPTGMEGQLVGRPVSVAIPTGMEGQLVGRPVSVAIPSGMDGEILSLPTSVSIQTGKETDPDLAAIWHFDGNGEDSSGNENHVTSKNGSSFSTDAVMGKSAIFPGGSAYFNSPTGYNLPLGKSQRTLLAWIKPYSFPDSTYNGIVAFGQRKCNEGSLLSIKQDGHLSMAFWCNDTYQTEGPAIELNTWNQVAFTYEGSDSVKFYVNGQFVQEAVLPDGAAVNTTNGVIRIGATDDPGRNFHGLIDEVAIYTRALTSEEILGNYNEIILETYKPSKPTVTNPPVLTALATENLVGTKQANTSLWIEGIKEFKFGPETDWQADVDLSYGSNNISILARDENGIASDALIIPIILDNRAPSLVSSQPSAGSTIGGSNQQIILRVEDEYAGIDADATFANTIVSTQSGELVVGTWSNPGVGLLKYSPEVPMSEGSYTVTCVLTDTLGNAETVIIPFQVDATPPVAPTVVAPSEIVGSRATLTGTREPGSTVELSLTSGAAEQISYPAADSWHAVVSGMKTDDVLVSVVAKDDVGNASDVATGTFAVDESLVGRWHMDSDWKDTSGHAHHGAAQQGAAHTDGGLFGSTAGIFDGLDGYVSVGSPALLDMDGELTLSVWAYPFELSDPESTKGLIAVKEGEYEIARFADGSIQVALDNTTPSWEGGWINTGFIAPQNAWSQLVLTYSESTGEIRFYANGELVLTMPGTGPIEDYFPDWNEFWFGGRQASLTEGWKQYFAGMIDEATVYRRALSLEEVQADYARVLEGSSFLQRPTLTDPVAITALPQQVFAGTKEAGTSLWVNGEMIVAADSTVTWQRKLTLEYGNNRLMFQSRDSDGNLSPPLYWNVVLDNQAPVVEQMSPADGQFISNASVNVSAQLSDAYAGVDLTDTLTQAVVTSDSGLAVAGQWNQGDADAISFAPDAPLAEGTYSVSFPLVDTLGNRSEFTSSFTVDLTIPSATGVTLNPQPPYSAERVEFTITFNEPMSNQAPNVELVQDGFLFDTTYPVAGRWISVTQWRGSYTFTQDSDEGLFVINVAEAADVAGNIMIEQQLDTIELDLTPPEAPVVDQVTSPTRLATQTLSGSKSLDTALLLNGSLKQIPISSEAWSLDVPLHEGTNTFNLQSRDVAGNDSETTTATIVLDTTAPLFTIDSYDPQSAEASQIIAGRKEPGSTVSLDGVQIVDATDLGDTWSHDVTLQQGVVTRLKFVACDSLENCTAKTLDLSYDQDPPPALASSVLQVDGEGNGSQVFLSWPSYPAPSDIAYYQVYFSDTLVADLGAMSSVDTVDPTQIGYTVEGLTEGQEYYFVVVPFDASGNSVAEVNPVLGVPVDVLPPEDVTNFKALVNYDATVGNQVMLIWQPSIDRNGDLTELALYTDGGNGYGDALVLDKALDTYTVSGLEDAALYKFKLTTRDDQGYESAGAVTQTVTRLSNPTNLAAEVGKNQVALSWQPVDSSYVKSYRVYRLQSETAQTSSTTMTLAKEVTGSSATITGLTNGVPYQFAVTTLNSYGAENTAVETITAQARQDAEGPVISLSDLVSGQVLVESRTIEVTASDVESDLATISLYIDDQLVTSYTPSSPTKTGTATHYWNLVETTDGPHTLWVTATDTVGNLSQKLLDLSVQQRPPETPKNLQHSVTSTTPEYLVVFSGNAEADTIVSLRLNGLIYPETATTSNGNFSFSNLPMVEGSNTLAVRATHRGGDSPWSADYTVVADTGAPEGQTSLTANLAAGGAVQFNWTPGAGEAPSGYYLYVSDSSFSTPTDAGVSRVNASKLLYTFKELVAADELEHYYAVSAVDAAGNESALSNVVAIAADRSAPQITEVIFTHSDGTTGDSFIAGPGTLYFTFTVSEPLAEVPFFSLEPTDGSPIIPTLTQNDTLTYGGDIRIDATRPHGTLTWQYSGKDALGNRTSSSGSAPTLDVRGPEAGIVEPVQLQQTGFSDVTVFVAFNEESVTTPQLEFVTADGSVIPVTDLAQQADVRNWTGRLDLTEAAEGTGTFRLVEARDRFGNLGQQVVAGEELLLYADLPPAPAAPQGLNALARVGGEVDLLWKTVTGASTYRLYRRLEGAIDYELIHEQSATAWRDMPPVDGVWEYAVSAVGPLGSESEMTAPVTVRSDGTAPGVPQGLELTIGGDGVAATWQAVTADDGDTVRYRLYRAGAEITTIAGLTAVTESDVPEALDGAATATLRHYVVTAIDAVGNESAPSVSVSIDFPVAPVKNLLVKQIETALPIITWEAPQSGIVGYTIYRNGQQVNETPTPGTTFTDVYYNGGSIRYGIEAIDTYGNHSPVREALLPQMTLGIAEGTTLRRGLLETIQLELQSEQAVTLDELKLKLGSAPQSILAGPITLNASTPQQVSKVAAAPLDAGSAVAAACTAILRPASGTIVEIVRTSQADVIGASAALEIFNEPLVRGTQAQVQLKLNNLGSAAMEVLTSENGGATNQVVVRLLDQDGNLLAQGRLNQRTGSQVINSSGYARARIEPNTSFLTDPITFRVPESAPYAVVLEAVVANTYYRYKQSDQVTAPGMRQTTPSTIAEVSYTAQAAVAQELYRQGEPVVITGQTLSTGDGSPMTYVPVRLGLSVNGFDRYFDLVSDEAGTFSYTYKPASNEAGSYSVWAVHPDLNDRSVQDRFDIIAMTLSPARYNLQLAKGTSYEIPITLTNYSNRELTELTYTLNTSTGLTAVVQGAELPENQILSGNEKQRLKVRVTADNVSHSTGYVTLSVDCAEGLSQRLDVNVSLVELIPIIRTSPSFIEAGMLRDSQKLVKFTLKNDGKAVLNNARIEGPSTAWMSLLVVPQIGSLAVGQSVEVGLLLQPGQSVPAGVYHDRLVIYSDNHIPYTYNITVTVTSDAVGNVAFDVQNELLEDVVGATINLQHQEIPDLYYTVNKDSSGTKLVNDLPEGRYSFNVSAKGHKPYSGSFVISPGITISVPVALEVTLVEFEWSVTEITIEDRYEITINQTFETNVPTSVIVVEPPGVNLPTMDPGGVYNGEFTITNYGLIRADFKGLSYPPSFDDYEMEVLGNIPTALEAYEQIVVPYRITRKDAAAQE